MFKMLRISGRFLYQPQLIKRIFLVGSSGCAYGFFKEPARDFMEKLHTIIPAKMDMALGIGLLLLASNAWFAYQYLQMLSKSTNSHVDAIPVKSCSTN